MESKRTLEIYASHGEEFGEKDLRELSGVLTEVTGREITVLERDDPDGKTLSFIIGD